MWITVAGYKKKMKEIGDTYLNNNFIKYILISLIKDINYKGIFINPLFP